VPYGLNKTQVAQIVNQCYVSHGGLIQRNGINDWVSFILSGMEIALYLLRVWLSSFLCRSSCSVGIIILI
jgi:hypothetical protein